jgi:hypothetical protein
MIHIQLRPRVSHRHIISVVVLFILVISVGDPGRIGKCDWLSAVGGLSIAVIMGIASFYGVLPFVYMLDLKDSWFGANFFGFRVAQTATRRILVPVGILLTYYAFVCRIFLVSGLEAAFLGVLFTTMTGYHLNPADHPSWTPYWLLPLVAIIVTVHTLIERQNLGKTGLNIVDAQEGKHHQ